MNFVFAVMNCWSWKRPAYCPTRRCARVWACRRNLYGWIPARGAHVEPGIEAPQGYAFRKLRGLFGVLDDHGMAQAGRAYQIAEWARTHRYCGACGRAGRARGGRVLPALPGLWS